MAPALTGCTTKQKEANSLQHMGQANQSHPENTLHHVAKARQDCKAAGFPTNCSPPPVISSDCPLTYPDWPPKHTSHHVKLAHMSPGDAAHQCRCGQCAHQSAALCRPLTRPRSPSHDLPQTSRHPATEKNNRSADWRAIRRSANL